VSPEDRVVSEYDVVLASPKLVSIVDTTPFTLLLILYPVIGEPLSASVDHDRSTCVPETTVSARSVTASGAEPPVVVTGVGMFDIGAFPIALTARIAYLTLSPGERVLSENVVNVGSPTACNGVKPAPFRFLKMW